MVLSSKGAYLSVASKFADEVLPKCSRHPVTSVNTKCLLVSSGLRPSETAQLPTSLETLSLEFSENESTAI